MASPEKLMFEWEPIVHKKPVYEDHVEVIISQRNIRCKGPEVGIRKNMQGTERRHAWLEYGERGRNSENEVEERDSGQNVKKYEGYAQELCRAMRRMV